MFRKVFFGCLVILLLSACAAPAAPVAEPLAAETAEVVAPETITSPTAEPPTPTTEPTATAEPTATEAVAADLCLECHLDQERLAALAAPEPEAESESSGKG